MPPEDAARRTSFPSASGGKATAARDVLEAMARHLLPLLVGAIATLAVTLAVALAATRDRGGDQPASVVAAPRVAVVLDAP